METIQQESKLCYTLPEFLKACGISRAYFYKLMKSDLGPTSVRVGTRRLIPVAEAKRWIGNLIQEQS